MANQSKAEPTSGNIVQAMAWRGKYRVDKNGKRTIPILLLGVHKQNRGGPYPAGLRCRSLCESSVTRGFNKEELNHAGVVVEERPLTAVAGANYVSMSEHNKYKSKSDELLATCFNEGADVRYGTLSHSHMLLVLRAWITKAKWDIPENKLLQLVFCDAEGRLSLSAVAAHPHATDLLASVDLGMDVEVLSHKMDIEEPSAAACISIA